MFTCEFQLFPPCQCVEMKSPCEKPSERGRGRKSSHKESDSIMFLKRKSQPIPPPRESVALPSMPARRENAPCCRTGCGAYQEVHHVGLVVPQCLHRVEDVHRPLVPEHLTDNADGAECPTAASPIPVGREIRWSHLSSCCLLTYHPSRGQQVTVRASKAKETLPLGLILSMKTNAVNELFR